MALSNLIERLNNELDKLNKLKNEEFDRRNFFTNDVHFNETPDEYLERIKSNLENNSEKSDNAVPPSENKTPIDNYQDIEPDNETKSLVLVKPNYLITAQTMFKRTIRFSLKSFLISISLSFLNLFV